MQKSKTFQTQRRKELFCQEEKDFGIGMSSLLVYKKGASLFVNNLWLKKERKLHLTFVKRDP